jgi:hypothetical protein
MGRTRRIAKKKRWNKLELAIFTRSVKGNKLAGVPGRKTMKFNELK